MCIRGPFRLIGSVLCGRYGRRLFSLGFRGRQARDRIDDVKVNELFGREHTNRAVGNHGTGPVTRHNGRKIHVKTQRPREPGKLTCGLSACNAVGKAQGIDTEREELFGD